MSTYADGFVRAVVLQDTRFWASTSQQSCWGRCRHHSDPGRSHASLLMLCFSVALWDARMGWKVGLLFCVKWTYFGQSERVSGLCPHVIIQLHVPVAVRAVQNAFLAIATRRFVDLCDYLRVAWCLVWACCGPIWPCKLLLFELQGV